MFNADRAGLSGPPDASRCADRRSARQQQSSLGPRNRTLRRRRVVSTTPTALGVATISVGVGSPALPAGPLRRPLRARVQPVAPRRRTGRRAVPRVRHPRARLRPYPLRCVRARVPARVLVYVPVLLPQLSRQAVGDPDSADTVSMLTAPVGGRLARGTLRQPVCHHRGAGVPTDREVG